MALMYGCSRHLEGGPVRETKAILVALTKEVRDAMTPDWVLDRVRAGNRRFRSGQPRSRDFREELKVVAEGQYPAAVLLSCIDSRVPAELILDLGLGDVFNCRVAGNITSPDVLDSLEYATGEAGAKVVLVLGHSGCGAVKGAIAKTEKPAIHGLRRWPVSAMAPSTGASAAAISSAMPVA